MGARASVAKISKSPATLVGLRRILFVIAGLVVSGRLGEARAKATRQNILPENGRLRWAKPEDHRQADFGALQAALVCLGA